MKSEFKLLSVLLLTLASAPVVLLAEPTVGPPVQAHGGQGGGKTRALDDLELTIITRAEEGYLPKANAVINARTDLVRASLQLAANSPALLAKAKSLADAELAYALSRADAFTAVKAQLKATTPAKVEIILRAMSDPAGTGSAGGGGPGGGRAGQAAPAAAPAGRGN
jgi:hypothetical protein